MNNFLFFMPPIVAAAAMPVWMAHCRKLGRKGIRRHWILHWIASLAPVGLLAILQIVGIGTETLILAVTLSVVLGVAAFAGGAIYLLAPFVFGLISATLLSKAMTHTDARVVRTRGARQIDDDELEPMTTSSKGIYLANSGVYRDDWYLYDDEELI